MSAFEGWTPEQLDRLVERARIQLRQQAVRAEAERLLAKAQGNLADLEAGVGRWPDGEPVHDLILYVLLACGHERVARGWRGREGDPYCCDVGCGMTTMVEIAMTDERPCPWRLAP